MEPLLVTVNHYFMIATALNRAEHANPEPNEFDLGIAGYGIDHPNWMGMHNAAIFMQRAFDRIVALETQNTNLTARLEAVEAQLAGGVGGGA